MVCRLVVLALSALVLSCGPTGGVDVPGERELGQATSPIVGGTPTTGDPAVVLLATRRQSGRFDGHCTGTLIGEVTVLTAAHCLLEGEQLYVLFGSSEDALQHIEKVVSQVEHPAYQYGGNSADLALLRLENPVKDVQPIALNRDPVAVGMGVRNVGFGVSDPYTLGGSGLKREVSYTIRNVFSSIYESGAPGQQVCFGDSGGPSFVVPAGSTTEVVAGVASFVTQPACQAGGYHVRVDRHIATFIEPMMALWEAPSCGLDFRCAEDCDEVDPDCYCIEDGQCVAECIDLTRDPDCPVDCVQNGVCALEACPAPDPDCRDLGGDCNSSLVCPSRICVGDPQHVSSYCSQACTTDADCPAPLNDCVDGACRHPQMPTANIGEPCDADTYCLLGGVCAGPGGAQRCTWPCSGPGTCPDGQACVEDDSGLRYCELPPVTPEEPKTPSPKPQAPVTNDPGSPQDPVETSSCAATGGGPGMGLVGLLLGAVLLRTRRSPAV